MPRKLEKIVSGRYKMGKDHKGMVLIIDDEEIVRILLGDMAGTLGYKAIDFSDPVEAVDYYKKNWKDIDLVLIDMVMPKLSGRETFFLLKQINSKIKAVVLSGFSMNIDIEVVLNDGCLDFLKKPVKLEVLKETFRKIFNISFDEDFHSGDNIEQITEMLGAEEQDVEEALKNMGGNVELFRKMLFRFINNYSESGNKIVEYSDAEKFEDIMILSHSIKSAAASLGLMKLSKLAETLEKASIEKNAEKCDEASDDFNEQMAFCVNRINQLQLLMNSSLNNNNEIKKAEKEVVAENLKELLESVKKRRPRLINGVINSKLKGISCPGFEFEQKDVLRKLASRYSYKKMEEEIKNIMKEVENG
jgi:CheY-like chemotaxis protein